MAYGNTPAEIEQAGRQLAQLITQQNQRLEAVEAAPARARLAEEWQSGQEYARASGYRGEALNELEQAMQDNNIWRHDHAIRLGLAPPSTHPFLDGPAEGSEMLRAIQSGNQEQYFDGLARQALREGRGG